MVLPHFCLAQARTALRRLAAKLDALSHYSFAPRPVVEDMEIRANVPALAMEDVAPQVKIDLTTLRGFCLSASISVDPLKSWCLRFSVDAQHGGNVAICKCSSCLCFDCTATAALS